MSRRRCQSLVFLNYGSHNTRIATSISFMPRTLMYLYKSARGISLYPPLLCLTLFGPIRITSSVRASLPLSKYPRPNTGPGPVPSCRPLYPLPVLSAVAESCANAAAACAVTAQAASGVAGPGVHGSGAEWMLAGAEGEGRAAGRLAGRPPSGAQGPAARDSGCIRRRAAARGRRAQCSAVSSADLTG